VYRYVCVLKLMLYKHDRVKISLWRFFCSNRYTWKNTENSTPCKYGGGAW